MKSILLSLCAAVALALAASPASAGIFERPPNPDRIPPYFRYGTAWRFYNYTYHGKFHPQYAAHYYGWRR